jgi:hypothetical protein
MKRFFAPILALGLAATPAFAGEWSKLVDPAGLEALRGDKTLIDRYVGVGSAATSPI